MTDCSSNLSKICSILWSVSSCLNSIRSSLWKTWALESRKWRIATNAFMMRILMSTAVSLWSTADNIATPCSVKAYGQKELCFKVLNLSQFATSSSVSCWFNWKRKASGNLRELRLTCSFKRAVWTPYSSARSRSRMTCTSLIVRIRLSTESWGRWSQFATSFWVVCSDLLAIARSFMRS